ncbi:MAG: hypothetical protein R3Y09_04350 [Clostridia bacterium]
MKNTTETKGITIPMEIIESVGLGEMITLSATNGLILLKNTDMTALEVIETIGALDQLTVQLYTALLSKFTQDDDCDCCSFCEDYLEDSVAVPDWALEAVGLPLGTKLCICAEEDSERIVLEPVEHTHDITDIDEEMLVTLSDMGICLGELNESIMRDEVIYSE